jgi:hypothetical protein
MSGETEKQVSDWTTDTLKQYYDQRMIDQEKAVAAAFDASNKAIEKSETASEKRFASVNEFRQTLTDQATTFLPRQEADRVTASNAEKIQALTDRLNRMDAQGEGSKITMGKLSAMLAAGGTIISIVIVLMNQYVNSAYRTSTAQQTQAVAAQQAAQASMQASSATK